jgi:hypothetical protein
MYFLYVYVGTLSKYNYHVLLGMGTRINGMKEESCDLHKEPERKIAGKIHSSLTPALSLEGAIWHVVFINPGLMQMEYSLSSKYLEDKRVDRHHLILERLCTLW